MHVVMWICCYGLEHEEDMEGGDETEPILFSPDHADPESDLDQAWVFY